MRGRTTWFVAGAAAGLYAGAKARRAAYRLSMPGLIDQAAALGVGWRAFASELRTGIAQEEQQVAARLGGGAGPRAADDTDQPLRTPTPIERDTA